MCLPLVPVQKQAASSEFQTSTVFFNELTAQSQKVVDQQAQISNPVIESLDPSVFEVTAKKNSMMWSSQQYRDAD